MFNSMQLDTIVCMLNCQVDNQYSIKMSQPTNSKKNCPTIACLTHLYIIINFKVHGFLFMSGH